MKYFADFLCKLNINIHSNIGLKSNTYFFREKLLVKKECSILISVLRIRIHLNPFHFYQTDPDPGRKKLAKIMENFQQKSTKIIIISYIFFKIINLCLTVMNIYPMNHKTDHFMEKCVSNRNKREKNCYFTKRIRGSGTIPK